MNLEGIANTDKTQSYFWAVCGTITVLVVSFIVVFGFKERLYGWVWTNRDYSRVRDCGQWKKAAAYKLLKLLGNRGLMWK